ncbi:hypothetical protein [Gordonia sp. OPL2]|uniref:hypothetical protein n=1 Tax=Gordonia sp. OPL2 TaxID=2486274 RepID=UPI0016552AD9|nr:hypothetical protein [Gordonia sp. OPL2]ROZ88996.1 hypothetical protein EEB19_20005 [Gordonia sp. OPL2]
MGRLNPNEAEMSLARRQVEVGALAAEGMTPQQIAHRLGLHTNRVLRDLEMMEFDDYTYDRPTGLDESHCAGSGREPLDVSRYSAGRGKCSGCGQVRAIRADGTMRRHAKDGAA